MCSLKLNVLPFLPSRCSAVAQWSDARKHIKFYGSFHIFLVVIMVWWFLGRGNKDKRRWNTTELKPSDETIKMPLHSWTSSSQTLKKLTLFRQLRRFKKYFVHVCTFRNVLDQSLLFRVWSRMSVSVWPLLCAVNSSVAAAGIFTARLDSVWSDAQVLWTRSHWVPEGQQWMWSEQQTAWKRKGYTERINLCFPAPIRF